MKLADIRPISENWLNPQAGAAVQQGPSLPDALKRVQQLLGNTYKTRQMAFERAKAELSAAQPNMASVADLVQRFRREVDIQTVLADADRNAFQQVYGGDKNKVHHDIVVLSKKWFGMLEQLAKERGVQIPSGSNVQRAAAAAGFRDPSVVGYSKRNESYTAETKAALLEMGIPAKYHRVLMG